MAFVSLKELKGLQYRVVDLHLIVLGSGACFLKVLKLFGSILSGIILFFVFKRKVSRGTKLCSYFNLHSLYNIYT